MGDRPSSFARSRQNALPKQPQQEQLFDTHPEVSLDFEIVRQAARQRYSRPFLIIDTAIVRGKVRRFRAAMPRVRPHYAVKANPDRRVLKVLVQEGAGFEIASTAELELLLGLGVAPAEIFFSNPVKSRCRRRTTPRPWRRRRRSTRATSQGWKRRSRPAQHRGPGEARARPSTRSRSPRPPAPAP